VEGPRFFSRGKPLAFREADRILDQFESLLNRHGLTISCGSKLEDIFLSTKKYLALNAREMSLPPTTDLRDEWVRMLGLVDLAFKVVATTETRFFEALMPHLKLLQSSTVDPSQNAPTALTDQANHKLFELLIAAACAPFAEDLLVEPPDANTSKTPDVTVAAKRRRWGIACKVLQTDSTARYRDNVLKGIRQIDRCDVDRGIVMINVKNLVPFETFLPFGRNPQEPYEIFESDAWTDHIEEFKKHLRARVSAERADIANAFRSSRKAGWTSVVCHYAQGMAWVRRDGEARMTPFVLVDPVFFSVFEPSPRTHRFLRALTDALQWGNGSAVTQHANTEHAEHATPCSRTVSSRSATRRSLQQRIDTMRLARVRDGR